MKEEILRRENQRVKQASKQVPSPSPETNSDPPERSENHSAPLLEKPVLNSVQLAPSSTTNQSVEVVKNSEITGKSKNSSIVSKKLPVNSSKDLSKAAESSSSPRQSSLKQQLLRKK